MKLLKSWRRHVIRPDSLETEITVLVPETALQLSDDKRADVLIAMHDAIRNALLFWEERAFHATSWGIGIELSAAAAWILYGTRCVRPKYQVVKVPNRRGQPLPATDSPD